MRLLTHASRCCSWNGRLCCSAPLQSPKQQSARSSINILREFKESQSGLLRSQLSQTASRAHRLFWLCFGFQVQKEFSACFRFNYPPFGENKERRESFYGSCAWSFLCFSVCLPCVYDFYDFSSWNRRGEFRKKLGLCWCLKKGALVEGVGLNGDFSVSVVLGIVWRWWLLWWVWWQLEAMPLAMKMLRRFMAKPLERNWVHPAWIILKWLSIQTFSDYYFGSSPERLWTSKDITLSVSTTSMQSSTKLPSINPVQSPISISALIKTKASITTSLFEIFLSFNTFR